ncbi:MAG TPA: ABC transporter permease [Vicinamibacterales bacterium]|nr:ABC transporter permease [Vicinamibacterales bacterium]
MNRRDDRGPLGPDPEQDVAHELSFHVDMRVEELVARGETRERALREVLDRFGDYEATRQECVGIDQARRRRMVRTNYVGDLVQDARYALRTLARAPGFAAAAVLTLAIGLTGTVSMVALIDGVLLRPLPVRAEAELVVGWRGLPEVGARQWPFSADDLALVRTNSRLLASVAGVGYQDPGTMPLADGAEVAYIRTARVTGEFFSVLGVESLLGRALGPDDDVAGAENVLVLSHAFWQARFGGAREVLGLRVTVGGQRFTIVGVMPRDVEHPRRVEAWMTPTAMLTTTSDPTRRLGITTEFHLLARLAPEVTAPQAADELRNLGPALDALRPAGDGRGFVPLVQPYREFVIGDVRPALLVLFAAVGLVLLIACANVSSLLLVRGDARRSEFAVRAALGAGRARLVRQVLAEGMVLASASTVVALLATGALLPILMRWVPDGLPRADAVHVNVRVVGVSLTLALVSAVLAALVPALTSVGRHLSTSLRAASRGTASSGGRWRRALVVSQVALAVVGLVCAALLVRSFRELRAEATRLASDQLVYVPLDLPHDAYRDRGRLLRLVTDLAEALEADPRVLGATPINVPPFSGVGWDVPVFTAEGQSDAEAKGNPPLNLEEIHPRYFSTFQVPLMRGRAFTAADSDTAPPVAIVSADVAARTWPGLDPIGRRVKMGLPASRGRWLTVVGITAPTRYRDLRTERSTLFVPALQMLGAAQQLAVRTSMPTPQLMALVQARVRILDANVSVMPLRAFTELLEVPLARPRFYTVLMTGFGATGLALAVVGLYGVIATGVRQRRREFGVRIALGAEPGHVRRLVLADGVWLVGLGMAVGLVAALVAAQALRGLLYGVGPIDLLSLGVSLVGLASVSAIALAVPLRAAGRLQPADVLRAE